MIAKNELMDGDTLEWTWNDKKIRYIHRTEYSYGAEELIEFVIPLPSLEQWVGESPGQAAYVKLKPIKL